ncbi:DUF6175 family protein [uncultured Draconibacterium sp.]|uniref:DUF6175 family protein n=1 Tax=uncultured Draconibacterium sp. TaxID=1573823 RepID=UPI002AA71F90|nr:DUF6175 family protein [uncultured Draconibacterium sp.]
MKNFFLLIFVLAVSINLVYGQAKKPTIMIVPSDVWCNNNGYMMEYDNEGTSIKIPDYKKALQEDVELLLVISKINGLMAERGFPLKNLESVLKSLENNSAEDAMMTSKETGVEAAESPIDLLKKTAKSDIILQLTWSVNQSGPKRSITFNMQGIDAYTDKQIATAVGTGAPSFSSETTVLLEEAVLAHIDNFNASLMEHFDDLFLNGREVTIRIRRWADWEYDLETEYGEYGDELGLLIEDWIADNAVEGRFNTTDATENMMLFEQVRIPLYYERNGRERAMDTRTFASELSRYLKQEPFNIVNKVTTQGLGRATIYLGAK